MESETPVTVEQLQVEKADLEARLKTVVELMDLGSLQAAYDTAAGTTGVQAPVLVLPAQERAKHWAEAFDKLAHRHQFPACWIAYQIVPASAGPGMIVMGGGHPEALKITQQRMAGNSGNPNEACKTCGCRIPPGRIGRECEQCRNKPKILLPTTP